MGSPVLVIDPALPALGAVLDGETMAPELGALLVASGLAGDATAWNIKGIEILKHKPGRRCAVAYSLEGPEGRRRLFAKTFRNDRGANIALNMASFARAIADRALVVPRPLGYLPELKLLVTEFVDGRPLADELYAGASDVPARRMAAAAAALHGCGVACARRWPPRKELRNTTAWVSGLSGRSPAAGARALHLLDRLGAWSERLPPVDLDRPVHRDFYVDQLLDAHGVTAILDLDDARAGDPAVDLGNFLAHLELRALQVPARGAGCARARAVFLEEYRTRTGEVMDERIRFYEASSLLRLSGVYAAREAWSDRLPGPLLDACEQILDRGGERR